VLLKIKKGIPENFRADCYEIKAILEKTAQITTFRV